MQADKDPTAQTDVDTSRDREENAPEEDNMALEILQSAGGTAEIVRSADTIPDRMYDRYSRRQKTLMVAFLSYCSFLSPISSTTTLSATPEIASELKTTGSIITLSNGIYLLFMGLSPIFWGPLSQVYGRRPVALVCSAGFLVCSIATALVPELISFYIFRILTAIEGTAFVLLGTAVVSDIYRPVERGTATSWLLTGMLVGPALGPFVGGVIVTFRSWRVIFWLQTALGGVAFAGAWFLPETIHHRKADDLVGYSGRAKARYLWSMINPWRILSLWRYPNILLVSLASASLLWNMYGLLAPIRYVLNPRYNLATPLEGGLFYLAPGVGYFLGTFFGGRYADHIVKKYMKKRNARIAEDRLISTLPFMALIAACITVYGWTIEMDVGGIPVTVICMFVQGVAQLFCFPSLNAYCLDVMPGRSAEVISANYSIRYLFATVSTSVTVPAIQSIGVGWFSTITLFILLASLAGLVVTVRYGKGMRERVDARKRKAQSGQA